MVTNATGDTCNLDTRSRVTTWIFRGSSFVEVVTNSQTALPLRDPVHETRPGAEFPFGLAVRAEVARMELQRENPITEDLALEHQQAEKRPGAAAKRRERPDGSRLEERGGRDLQQAFGPVARTTRRHRPAGFERERGQERRALRGRTRIDSVAQANELFPSRLPQVTPEWTSEGTRSHAVELAEEVVRERQETQVVHIAGDERVNLGVIVVVGVTTDLVPQCRKLAQDRGHGRVFEHHRRDEEGRGDALLGEPGRRRTDVPRIVVLVQVDRDRAPDRAVVRPTRGSGRAEAGTTAGRRVTTSDRPVDSPSDGRATPKVGCRRPRLPPALMLPPDSHSSWHRTSRYVVSGGRSPHQPSVGAGIDDGHAARSAAGARRCGRPRRVRGVVGGRGRVRPRGTPPSTARSATSPRPTRRRRLR